ncbi:MAG TPA: pyridoxamine 5'-phosphate oxidase family protein [Baekduia sp.]|nr:pyridoxamine 5'-phosphate oxidase family protein [Baekduia sp.]
MSRRAQITMSDAEVLAFLAEERVMTCATMGPRGWPHLMPLWYVVRDERLWAWTYARSQKAVNLERDPRATVQVEAGRDQYPELRGVMLETDVRLHRDIEAVTALGLEIFRRYTGGDAGELAPEVEAMVRAQAAKRVGMEFVERHRATWDHRKLGNVY